MNESSFVSGGAPQTTAVSIDDLWMELIRQQDCLAPSPGKAWGWGGGGGSGSGVLDREIEPATLWLSTSAC